MREIDPRDCQHGEADATQEHIEQLQARIAQLEDALCEIVKVYNDAYDNADSPNAVWLYMSDMLVLASEALYLKQVREECATVCDYPSLCGADESYLQARIAQLEEALRNIKNRVCGEAMPNWENTERTGLSRGWIADEVDIALSTHPKK